MAVKLKLLEQYFVLDIFLAPYLLAISVTALPS